jgi:hypothetical protein
VIYIYTKFSENKTPLVARKNCCNNMKNKQDIVFFHILQKWQNNQDIVGIHIMCNKMAAL